MKGILIVNKQKGYTSHDLVNKVKRICNEKVGHTGTLDPMATGVLPLLIGEATKLSKYLIEHDKEYEVVLQLGSKTDTADSEGNTIETKQVLEEKLQKENVENILKSFLGKQKQIPPMYSAIKVKGKKLYEYARQGKQVDVPEREIEIYQIKLNYINIEEKNISFSVHCSKGTYIRSICENIAEKLETVGYMKKLNRTRVGKFCLNKAINIDLSKIKRVEELSTSEKEKLLSNIKKNIITMEEFLKDSPKTILNEKQLSLFLNGVLLNTKEVNGIYRVYNSENKFIGTGVVKEHRLKRDII